MTQAHEVGRTSYETYCDCIGSDHDWNCLSAMAKDIWKKVELAGLQASARALAYSAEQPELNVALAG